MSLFRHNVIAIIIFLTPFTVYAHQNSVEIQTSYGSVNINFNNISDESKKAIIKKVLSDEIEQIGDKEFFNKNYPLAITIFRAAQNIDQNNMSAFIKINKAIVKSAIKNNKRDRAYESFFNEALSLSKHQKSWHNLDEDYVKIQALYLSAASLYEQGSKKHQQAYGSYHQIIAAKASMSNALSNPEGSSLKEDAEKCFVEKKYIEAIFKYSSHYAMFEHYESLENISKIITIINSTTQQDK